MDEAILALKTLKPMTLNVFEKEKIMAVKREKISVHGMSGMIPCRDNNALSALRKIAENKKTWQSDYGDSDGSGIELARSIQADLSYLAS